MNPSPITADQMMAKAQRALTSAQSLLELEDHEGACNRAYYAMFDAARAALLYFEPSDTSLKTHRGVINAFGLRFVKTALLPTEFGYLLKRAEELRILGDYQGDMIDKGDANTMLDYAQTFVTGIQALVKHPV